MQITSALAMTGVSIGVSFGAMTLDLDSLPQGAPPAIPWYADGAIHSDAPDDRPVDVAGGSPGGFAAADGGFVVHLWASDSTDDAMQFLGPKPKTLDLAPGDTHDLFGPVVSADGSLIAWTGVDGLDGDSFSTRLVLADGRTGEVLRITNIDDDLRPVGFLGSDQLVLRRGTEPGAATWTLGTDRVSAWPRAQAVTAVSPRHRLAAVVRGEDATGAPCTSIVDLTKGERELWRTCELRVTSFSPDGARALGVLDQDDGTYARAVRSRTGETIGQVTVGGDATAAWEDSEHLLLSAWDDRRQALVRWEVAGDKQYVRPPLELATEPREGGSYLLPRQ